MHYRFNPLDRLLYARFIAQQVTPHYERCNGASGKYVATRDLLAEHTAGEINGMIDAGMLAGPKITRRDLCCYSRLVRSKRLRDPDFRATYGAAHAASLAKGQQTRAARLADAAYARAVGAYLTAARRTKMERDPVFRQEMERLNAQKLSLAQRALKRKLQKNKAFRARNRRHCAAMRQMRTAQQNYDYRTGQLRAAFLNDGVDADHLTATGLVEYVQARHPELLPYYPSHLYHACYHDLKRLRAVAGS